MARTERAADRALLLQDLTPAELAAVRERFWGLREQVTVTVERNGVQTDQQRRQWPSEREVARRLGVSVAHVRRLLSGARRKVERRMKQRLAA